MLQTLLIMLSCLPALSVAQVTIDPMGAVTVVEGGTLTITCAEVGSPGSAMELRKDGVLLTGTDIPPDMITSSMRTYSLLVNRTMNGSTYDCLSRLSPTPSEEIKLTVAWNDPISLSVSTDSVLEITVSISLNANPTPVITVERMDGMTVPDKDARVTIGANTIVFRSLTDTDNGTYIVTVTNAAGSQMATFFLSNDDVAINGSGTILAAGLCWLLVLFWVQWLSLQL